MASACEVPFPTIHCSSCGLAQYYKSDRAKCLRCRHDLKFVEKAPEEPKKPVLVATIYPYDEYVRRLENSICFAIRRLRKKAGLKQKQVADRGGFGARTYVSKVENPLGANRTIPNLKSLGRFAIALNVEAWQIVAMAENEAGKPIENEWVAWWSEMVPWLKRVRPKDWQAVLTVARSLKARKSLPAESE